ncbi:MAG: exodeoxyribonuclease VII large subunit [Planctomycetota bacterium]|nr:exodeoxyribonuclease VII large subunit [Planctomycetota bacterium]
MIATDARPAERRPLTVSELTRLIKRSLEERFHSVLVRGEVSSIYRSQVGHLYFTLKDATSQVRVVMWASQARALRFSLEDGKEVIVAAGVSVYEPKGEYQLIATWLEPCGVGALQLAFEQLKDRLEKEGLFDESRKKRLPFIPRVIALVTSPTGAAVRDMLNIIDRQFPSVRIIVYAVKVQGAGAAEEISAAIDHLNTAPAVSFGVEAIDVMIVGRGGGSLEDLWCFNEETVARAITRSKIPVISAVGHETDVTISDLVADCRALTPSDAARIVVPVRANLAADLAQLEARLGRGLLGLLALTRSRLDAIRESHAMRSTADLLQQCSQETDDASARLSDLIRKSITEGRSRLETLGGKLDALSPLGVLARGYSITRRVSDGRIVDDGAALKPGDRITSRFHVGRATSVVEDSDAE